jgi:hypothetical protein
VGDLVLSVAWWEAGSLGGGAWREVLGSVGGAVLRRD